MQPARGGGVIEKILRSYDEIGAMATDGTTDISQFPSITLLVLCFMLGVI